MKVDLSLKNAKVYDVDRIDVVKGETFSLTTDYDGHSRWFSDKDKVLKIFEADNAADIEATEIGASTIVIVGDQDFSVLKQITIRVVDAIVEPVKSLGLEAEDPILK
jgi:hypothetical protein